MSKLLIPNGLDRPQLDAFRSVESELNKLANGGALARGAGVPTLTSNLQDGSLYYDYSNLNLYVFDGSTASNAAPVVTGGVSSQWRSAAGVAEAQATAIESNVYVSGTTKINGANVQTGTLSASLITTGTLSADRIVGGTLVGAVITATSGNANTSITGAGILTDIIIAGTGNVHAGKSFYVTGANTITQSLFADQLTIGPNISNVSYSGFIGNAGAGVGLQANAGGLVNSNNHAFRGKHETQGTSGLVGPANGFDFYAEGSGTNYGPFTGAHDAVVPLATSVVMGDIMVDVERISSSGLSNVIFRVSQSTTPNQKAAVGIAVLEKNKLADGYAPSAFVVSRTTPEDNTLPEVVTYTSEWNTSKNIYKGIIVNALGEGQVNIIGEGGDLVAGDLIVTSSTPGKGMKQSDDIVRACTVAKVREAVTFSSLTEEKQVACIYLCG